VRVGGSPGDDLRRTVMTLSIAIPAICLETLSTDSFETRLIAMGFEVYVVALSDEASIGMCSAGRSLTRQRHSLFSPLATCDSLL
jgi:hypothetical protein